MKKIFGNFVFIVILFLASFVFANPNVGLQWDPPIDNVYPVLKYTLYWGTTSGIYDKSKNTLSGSETTITIEDLEFNTTYYFAVTATYQNGESTYSNEVSTTTPEAPKPAPQNLRLSMDLTFDENGNLKIAKLVIKNKDTGKVWKSTKRFK